MLQKTFVLLVLAGVPGALPAPAAALSTRFYVGATLGSINVSADEVDGRSLSAGALVGVTALHGSTSRPSSRNRRIPSRGPTAGRTS
jgi:hypothetical protein